jgi:hypothetical protein
MSQLSFFSVLNLGVKSMLSRHDHTMSSYRILDEAFARGVILVKRRLAAERAESSLQEAFLPNLADLAFPKAGTVRNVETETLESNITWNMDRPENYDCAELHVFTDNSIDASKVILDCLHSLATKVVFKDQVVLELIGQKDPRACSALLSLYGPDGFKLAHGISGFLDKNLHQHRRGYAFDVLYPPKSPYWASFCFESGKFHKRKQLLLQRIFTASYDRGILHLSEFHAQYGAIKADFFKPK